jgi:hypothetical protein
MATINLKQTPTSTPAQFVAGLTDFRPGRSKLFGRSADDYLKVHRQGPTEADVTEGSGGVWERLHYDWSDPNRVVMTTTDSNTWGGASGHTYTFTRQPDGTTDVDVVVVRDGKNVKGRLLGGLIGIVGKRVLGKELAKTAKAIEARTKGREPRNWRKPKEESCPLARQHRDNKCSVQQVRIIQLQDGVCATRLWTSSECARHPSSGFRTPVREQRLPVVRRRHGAGRPERPSPATRFAVARAHGRAWTSSQKASTRALNSSGTSWKG